MEAGIDVILGSENDLWRMAETSPALALGLVGREPVADLETMLDRGGLIWMLAGAQYQTNIGYCIRVAEVSGANGVIVTDAKYSELILCTVGQSSVVVVLPGCVPPRFLGRSSLATSGSTVQKRGL